MQSIQLNMYVGKADLSKSYLNPKRKLGTMYFSEITKEQ